MPRTETQKRSSRNKNAGTTGVSPSKYIGHISDRIEVCGEYPPPDTRDLTARLLGDPVPGRRWIDRVKSKQGA